MKSAMLERQIEAKVCDWARRHKLVPIKVQGPTNKGMPDRLFLLPGNRPIFIEFKRPGCKATALQEHTHERLRSLGFTVEVCDSYDLAVAILQRELDAT